MVAEGVDCYDPVSGAQAAEMAAEGISFVCRYAATKGSSSLTAGEAAELHGAGLDVGLIYETTGRAALGGSTAGQLIGAAAASAARALGAPGGTCVYVAETDFDVQEADMPTVTAFYDAATASLRGAGFRSGGYGGLRVALALPGHVDYVWQTAAWSTRQWAYGAALQQYMNGVTVAGMTCDRTRAMVGDWGQWRAAAIPIGGDDVPDQLTLDWSAHNKGVHAFFAVGGPLHHSWSGGPGEDIVGQNNEMAGQSVVAVTGVIDDNGVCNLDVRSASGARFRVWQGPDEGVWHVASDQ